MSSKLSEEPSGTTTAAQLLNWSGLPLTLTVPVKCADGVCAGGCELDCSPRRYGPLRHSLFVRGVAWRRSEPTGDADCGHAGGEGGIETRTTLLDDETAVQRRHKLLRGI